MSLIFNLLAYDMSSDLITYTPDKISIAPKLPCPQLFRQFQRLLKYLAGRHTFQYLHCLRRGISRRYLNQPRLTASHFPPASKLTGIQWAFL